jgi:GNAT superfamily N-acetyltransferase
MKVSAYRKEFDREGFSCGSDELDFYLKRHLSQDIRRNAAACFILHEAGELEVLGYCTLSAFSVRLEGLPETERKTLPRYPQVPLTLLGRLAISRGFQGKGLGQLLLLDALNRARQNRAVIASWAVVVNAITEEARSFYLRYGFEMLLENDFRLFLPMKRIGKLFE